MERYAWKATLKDGMLEEYKKRHDNIWYEMKQMFNDAGIRNYSIWNVGNELFGYYECDSIEKAGEIQRSNPISQKWEEHMKDVMTMKRDPITGAQPLMQQVFLFDPETN